MKYIYTNVTRHMQACTLASKNQDSVGVRTFLPGASLTLDYPGLSMYVPHTLHCIEVDVTNEEPVPVAVVIPKPEPVVAVVPEPIAEPEPIVVPEPEPTAELVVEVAPEAVVVPEPETKAKIAKPKTPRKTKK